MSEQEPGEMEPSEVISKKIRRLEKKKAAAFLQLIKQEEVELSQSEKRNVVNHSPESDEPTHKKIRSTSEGCGQLDADKESSVGVHHRGQFEEMSPSQLEEFRRIIRQRQKAAMQKPKIFLTLNKMATYNNPLSDEAHLEVPPMFLADLQHLVLYGLQGQLSRFKPRWCQLLRVGKVSSVLVITLDSVSCTDFTQHPECFQEIKELFDMSVEMVSPMQYGSNVPDELFRVPVSRSQLEKLVVSRDQKKNLIPLLKQRQSKMGVSEASLNEVFPGEAIPRTHLLLNLGLMVQENYPLPVQASNFLYEGFVFSKDSYATVNSRSPLFAVDCEMCMTTLKKSELCRVTVVNEKMETVYDTLIKPYNRVINYLTRFSGITKAMLDPVTTRLKDAQKRICEILPRDAILCGQSLNMDLMALQMFHPYVIDTSVIYNLTGDRSMKSSLKKLTASFLGRTIQENVSGHCSIEDATATMELVLLKLKKGLEFGDVILTGLESLSSAAISPQTPKQDTFNDISGSENTPTSKLDTPNSKLDTPNSETSTPSSKIETSNSDMDTSSSKTSKQNEEESVHILPDKVIDVGVSANEAFFQKVGNILCQSFFEIMSGSKKTVAVIKSGFSQFESLEESVTASLNSDKECKKAAKSEIHEKDFVYLHLSGFKECLAADGTEQDRKKSLRKLDKRVWKIMKYARPNSVVCVVLPGRREDSQVLDARTFVKVS